MSLPIANGTAAAATAPAGPLDDPLVHRPVSHGLAAAPVDDAFGWSYPMPPANSIVASLAARMAPAVPQSTTTVASRSNAWIVKGRSTPGRRRADRRNDVLKAIRDTVQRTAVVDRQKFGLGKSCLADRDVVRDRDNRVQSPPDPIEAIEVKVYKINR